ncbi:MAG: 5-methyltetrahydropteroyltriglutamate--homocysteine methyltransferase [Planctomycetia bacterium]|nr:5-methyltetrahydropteroyltriglutamate--homocysteine methyltransferase [Planctomycetia bacterium]
MPGPEGVAPPDGVARGGDGRDLPWVPDASFDGGELDCGSGLPLLIRRHIDPLAPGRLLELRSREKSVEEDLPAWCRMTGNELVHHARRGDEHVFLVAKGAFVPPAAPAAPAAAVGGAGREARAGAARAPMPAAEAPRPVVALASLPAPAPAPAVPPLAVFGVGSWPRPRWMLRAIHDRLEGRMSDEEFQATADDAVRLAVEAQLRAGVDVVTDGEQRRDSYASFVGARLDNCQLVPVTDLLPYVEDPAAFERELRALDVPAEKVRHPAVFGRLSRPRPLARHEAAFVRGLTDRPVKVALPGPYLLTRTLWMECVSDRAYATREALAADVVRVLREEVAELLADGVALVQLDEPVLSEVVFGAPSRQRTFMCGALDARRDPAEELALAARLLGEVTATFPRDRLAFHVCRGNWTPDERAALAGDYGPLLPFLADAPVGLLVLEACTHRAGALEVLADLPRRLRVGVGVLDQKSPRVESVDEVHARMARAVAQFGPDRVVFHPDCGFATFADNPIAPAAVAEAKLRVAAEAARRFAGAKAP